MNKLVKASIAGAAGFALLLGGAGTFALWNTAPTSFSGAAIQSGALHVALTDYATAKYTATNNPVSYIVPGDAVSVVQPVNITATGDNLKVSLSFDVNLGSPATALELSLVTVANPFTFKTYNAAGTEVPYTNITGVDAAQIKYVVGSFTFPVAAGNDTQNSSVNISRASLTVNQVQ